MRVRVTVDGPCHTRQEGVTVRRGLNHTPQHWVCLSGFCLIVIKGDRWALGEVCALGSALGPPTCFYTAR